MNIYNELDLIVDDFEGKIYLDYTFLVTELFRRTGIPEEISKDIILERLREIEKKEYKQDLVKFMLKLPKINYELEQVSNPYDRNEFDKIRKLVETLQEKLEKVID